MSETNHDMSNTPQQEQKRMPTSIRAIWRELYGSESHWLRKQIPLIVLIVVGVVFHITNRYQAQKDIIEMVQLQKELKDIRFRVLTRSSEITLKTRQSTIEQRLRALGDTTLTTKGSSPFILNK